MAIAAHTQNASASIGFFHVSGVDVLATVRKMGETASAAVPETWFVRIAVWPTAIVRLQGKRRLVGIGEWRRPGRLVIMPEIFCGWAFKRDPAAIERAHHGVSGDA